MSVVVTGKADAAKLMQDALAVADKKGGVKNIIMLACGGSHACFYPAEYFLRNECADVMVHNISANEFNYAPPACLGENSLVFAISLSGGTPETVSAAANAKKAGATVVALVAEENTKLAAQADFCAYYGIEIGNPCNYQSQYVAMLLAVEFLQQTRGFKNYAEMMDGFDKVISVTEQTLVKIHDQAMAYGQEVVDEPVIYTVGSGPNTFVAYMQSICMFMEMEWVHSSSIHSGEFFHGPFEVTDEKVPFMVFVAEGKTRFLDERAINFLRRHTGKITLLDAREYGIGCIDESVVDYFNPILLWSVALEYSEGLAQAKHHPLLQRRYMGKEEY